MTTKNATKPLGDLSPKLCRNLAEIMYRLLSAAHDFRNSATVILGILTELAGQKLDDKTTQGLQYGIARTEYTVEISAWVLNTFRTGRNVLQIANEEFDLHDLVNEVAELIRPSTAKKGLRLLISISTPVPRKVKSDEARLRSILYNLLSNAVKFTEQGTISLRVGMSGRRVIFKVSDTGCGMSQSQIGRLFRPFTQVGNGKKRKEGTGMGLFTSAYLARSMGSRKGISVTSKVGKGSTFTFSLPLAAVQTVALSLPVPAPAVIASTVAPSAYTCLVVEEDSAILTLLRIQLQNNELFDRVLDTGSLEGMRRCLETNRPDVTIVDVSSEENALEALRLAKLANPDTRAIIVANDWGGSDRQLLDAGAQAVVRKPLNIKELIRLMQPQRAAAA